ncbi:hypothetical protein ACHWQZ_G005057 [Mnemiopsis leidyi]
MESESGFEKLLCEKCRKKVPDYKLEPKTSEPKQWSLKLEVKRTRRSRQLLASSTIKVRPRKRVGPSTAKRSLDLLDIAEDQEIQRELLFLLDNSPPRHLESDNDSNRDADECSNQEASEDSLYEVFKRTHCMFFSVPIVFHDAISY